jgi:acyl dehydratase
MLEVEFPSDMKQYVGQKVGSSDWLTVDQKRIDDFAAVSGDHNWIHIDRERAKQQRPDGKTITSSPTCKTPPATLPAKPR